MAAGNPVTVKITLKDGAKSPVFATPGAAGADLSAFLPEGDVVLKPGKRALIPTGIFMELPEGYEAQVRPRSGLAIKHGISMVNAPGTVDSDYRGELKVILINHGEEEFVVKNGERIGQMVIAPVTRAEFVIADELSQSERGAGGFGSTGVN